MHVTDFGYFLYEILFGFTFITSVKTTNNITKYMSWKKSKIYNQEYLRHDKLTYDTEILKSGIDSEYFLACFLKGPASGYALGQIVQNKQKPNPKTVYSVTGRLCKTGYLRKDENGFCINSEQLVEDIDRNLKRRQVGLSEKEKKILAGIMQNKGPFVSVSDNMIQKIHRQSFRVHDIDALDLICDRLGEFSASFLISRKTMPNTNMKKMSTNEPQQTLDLLAPIWSQIGPKLDNAIQWSKDESRANKRYTKNFPYEKSLEQFPDIAIIKEAFANVLKNQKLLKQKKTKTSSDKNAILFMKKFADSMQTMMKAFPATKAFVELPEETLVKLCSLWNQGNGFLFAWKTLSKK